MTVEAFMTEPVTIRTPTGEMVQSLGGEVTEVVADEFDTVLYLEPRDIRTTVGEARERGYVPVGDWLGVGRADVDFGTASQVVWYGRVFDVVSPPRVMPNPRLGTMSHTELDLQLVGDMEDVS
jgi:hypothetical protein